MDDAMVTARMSRSKKDAGNRLLAGLGYSASRAINELYDCVIATGSLPFASSPKAEPLDAVRLQQALAFVDGIAIVPPGEFDSMDAKELKRRKLIARGHASEEDFA